MPKKENIKQENKKNIGRPAWPALAGFSPELRTGMSADVCLVSEVYIRIAITDLLVCTSQFINI